MVEGAVGPGDEGEVVGGVGPLEERGQLVPVVGHDLLGQPEVEHRAEEVGHAVDVLAHQEDVVDAGRMDADQTLRLGRRVVERQQVADLLHAPHEVDGVGARSLEPDDLALARAELAGIEALGRDAGGLDPLLILVEVDPVLDLEGHALQPVDGRVAQDDRVVLLLVPSLEEDPLRFPGRLDQAEHLGVVGGGQLEIGNLISACDNRRIPIGVDLHKALVDFSLVVDGAADVVLGPGDGPEVGVGPVAAGEHLVAGPHRVEEVDGVAPGHAVACRADVDLDGVVGQDVGCLAHVVPVVEPEGEMVERTVGAVDHGQVVGRCRALEPPSR